MSWMAGHSPQSCFIQFAVDLVLGYARYCKMHSTFERLLSLLWDTLSAFGMWSVLDCMICKDKVRIILPDISVDMAYGFFCRESTKALLCVCSAATALWETLSCLTFWSCHTLGRKYMKRWRSPRWSWQSTSQSSLPSTLGEQICFKLEVLMECFFERGPWWCDFTCNIGNIS